MLAGVQSSFIRFILLQVSILEHPFGVKILVPQEAWFGVLAYRSSEAEIPVRDETQGSLWFC